MQVARDFAKFQSMHSLRSATLTLSTEYTVGDISIHALLTECNEAQEPIVRYVVKFQSMHSLRSATPAISKKMKDIAKFQSMHSLRSATFSWEVLL